MGGEPNNRVIDRIRKAIPLKNLKINRAGSNPALPPIAACPHTERDYHRTFRSATFPFYLPNS